MKFLKIACKDYFEFLISRQWSNGGIPDGDWSVLPSHMERARLGPCREHRSQSDTTAMEVASLRHQYNKEQLSNYLSPKLLNRPQRGNSSVSSKTDQPEQVF